MSFTVLGAGGFIGRHLAAHLQRQGHSVVALGREDALPKGSLGHVIYCIGLTANFRRRPFETVDAHITVLSDVLKRAEFHSLLYLSSTRVYAKSISTAEDALLAAASGDPSDLYNLSKVMGESLCLNSGRQGTRIARLSNVVGFDPGSDNFLPALIRQALGGRIVLRSALDSAKDYVALDDVLNVLPQIALRGSERIYNVAGGRNFRNSKITGRLQALTGCEVSVCEPAPVQSFPIIDIGRLREEFAFAPSNPLAGLSALVGAYRSVRSSATSS